VLERLAQPAGNVAWRTNRWRPFSTAPGTGPATRPRVGACRRRFRFDLQDRGRPDRGGCACLRLRAHSGEPLRRLRCPSAGYRAARRPGENCQTLVARDYREVVTYSFIDAESNRLFTGKTTELELSNPMSSEMSVMRSSLLPGMLMTAATNLARQQERIRLFEIGTSFHGTFEEAGGNAAHCRRGARAGCCGTVG
jgi:hypothetical protein